MGTFIKFWQGITVYTYIGDDKIILNFVRIKGAMKFLNFHCWNNRFKWRFPLNLYQLFYIGFLSRYENNQNFFDRESPCIHILEMMGSNWILLESKGNTDSIYFQTLFSLTFLLQSLLPNFGSGRGYREIIFWWLLRMLE